MVKELQEKIKELVAKTDDVILLDLICQMLKQEQE